jgi:lipid-A-disaccharide synthase-like uncharacterized protein
MKYSIFSHYIQQLQNPLVLFGFLAQFIFFMRFVLQWIVSEKQKKSVIPVQFWYLSVVGSIMILIYSIGRGDIVFAIASCLNTLIYIRNLVLINKRKVKVNPT